MKKQCAIMILLACMVMQGTAISAEELYSEDAGEATQEARQTMLYSYGEKMAEVQADPERMHEVTPEVEQVSMIDWETQASVDVPVEVCTIEMGSKKMQYTKEVIGEPDENGLYPLYITLHGGGEAEPEENNEQWLEMAQYYRESVTDGVYVATRGMEDVWNLHFMEESYPMYDRLIEDMILMCNVDPNRVYLLGFSAGGDGVYAIAPRMADRFAAVNMSSGHPNGVSLVNTFNLPFEIQVGIHDYYSEDVMRSIRGAEFEETFQNYQNIFGLEYPHLVLVHVPEGHNYNDYSGRAGEGLVLTDPTEFATRAKDEDWLSQFMDIYTSLGNEYDVNEFSYDGTEELCNALQEYITNDLQMEVDGDTDTNAVHFCDRYTRKPFPKSIVWDLSTRADLRTDKAFYWLKADDSMNGNLIMAWYDEDENCVTIDCEGDVDGEITLLATPFLMDFDRPLTVITPDESFTVDLNADDETILNSINETGDVYLSWADEITVPVHGSDE